MQGSHQLSTAAHVLFNVVLPAVAVATPVMLLAMAMRARRQGLSLRNAVLLFAIPLTAALPLILLMIWIGKAAIRH